MAAVKTTVAAGDEKKPVATSSMHRILIMVGAAAGFVVIALGLGLGLGLGLKHHTLGGSTHSSSSATPTPTTVVASDTIQPWRRNTQDYNLDMNWNNTAAPTTRVYNWTLTEIQIAPDGVERTVLAINGMFPGPVVEVNVGDRILVNLTNHMSNATTMHWHGLYQNGTNWMDGVNSITQCGIPPNTSFLYNFTIENQYGTFWYHSHTKAQYTDGLVGPLIVHSPEEDPIRELYDYDQVVLVQDWYHDLSSALMEGYLASGNENTEPTPDNGLIQGTNYFDCSSYSSDSGYTCHDNSTRAKFPVTKNKRYRLRLINAGSFAEMIFSVDNHTLSVIEADGVLVEPVTVHRIPVNIAQRYSVIIEANQTSGNYWMRCQMNQFCFSQSNPVLDSNIEALVTYDNTTTEPAHSSDWLLMLQVSCIDLDPSLLVPYYVDPAPKATVQYIVEPSFQIGAYALDRGYFNSTTWVASSTPTVNLAVAGLQAGNSSFSTTGLSRAYDSHQFVLNVGGWEVVDLLINNLDEGSHPFHLHGYTFWVMAQSSTGVFDWNTYDSLNTTNPMRRDTIMINAYGWALIRFRADNPGIWALHCHISWHIEAGLLMQVQTRDDLMKDWTIPADVLALCEA
ncbi:multicopper oxidase-2 [Coleophoma cylindrospora]|uniref:Multicopper oxidase-2 n=1 Tax=Coleophoma cylindrospora TaxID=1849047 RepID=A0A3D8SNW2_9HELO|nr:multicopper oxidase-2 [Coleophoma cylindrospora]